MYMMNFKTDNKREYYSSTRMYSHINICIILFTFTLISW